MSILDLYSTPSRCFECEFSLKFVKILVLGPICLNKDFRYKFLNCQCQIRTQCLQIDKSAKFQANLMRF